MQAAASGGVCGVGERSWQRCEVLSAVEAVFLQCDTGGRRLAPVRSASNIDTSALLTSSHLHNDGAKDAGLIIEVVRV